MGCSADPLDIAYRSTLALLCSKIQKSLADKDKEGS